MGVESANYLYHPASLTLAAAHEILEAEGATHTEDKYWVISDDSHWVDFEIWAQGDSCRDISLRIALPNPVTVLPILRSVLDRLLSEGGGEVIDRDDNQEIASLTNEKWEALKHRYLNRRRLFHQRFGEFTVAISGDKVFDYIHEHIAKEPSS